MAMRTRAILRRSTSVFNRAGYAHSRPLLSFSSRPLFRPKNPASLSARGNRFSSFITSDPSTSPPDSPENDPGPGVSGGDGNSDQVVDNFEKPKRRYRTPMTSNKDSDPVQLPDSLDILWIPTEGSPVPDDMYKSALPPPDIFGDALNNLLIALHPQTQHRAAYSSSLGPPTEPTLALYCPIEGGDYVIDATVRELARRTAAEVLVLDTVQLAAGEWGHFGAAANSISLPRNPLHFPSPLPSSSQMNSPAYMMDEDDDPENPPPMFLPPRYLTLTLMAPPAMQSRAIVTSPPRRQPSPPKAKVFFDALVNTPSPNASSSSRGRPRIVYIRDFPTLAPSSSAWYPPLLSAVRERRRGPISRASSPVVNPITIIFGITPPLTPPPSYRFSGASSMGVLLSRNTSTHVSTEGKTGNPDWGENDVAEKAREYRFRERLKKWERGDVTLLRELPKLFTVGEGDVSEDTPEIVYVGTPPKYPPMFGTGVPSPDRRRVDAETESFFRTSVLVPGVRSTASEKAIRIARRREINELTMRMGVGAAGGALEQTSATAVHVDSLGSPCHEPPRPGDDVRMWEDWGNKIEAWPNVRQIADRAIGDTLSSGLISDNLEKASLNTTDIPWSAVHKAWATHHSSRELRKAWLKDSALGDWATREDDKVDDEREQQLKADELIERIKHDNDLDPHEQKLLPCIVDAASMRTSFDQVHLPPHTIDSVRTIVSLPLLHPEAFQQGILKEHGMTGCLLFGPPGTGKTLVVRALAKEAGCRMISISPSDVMDMYVGEGEKLVKAVFSLARRLAPCVVFLDEIDALFGARTPARESGGAFAHRGVITEFMQEMDGLKSSREDRVIVIGATNRPFDLDDAVLRRLPRRLLVDLPGEKEREEILKILLRDEILADDLDIQSLAKKTESFSGSDLKHLCVSAALDAVKANILLPWAATPSQKYNVPDQPPLTLDAQPSADPFGASVPLETRSQSVSSAPHLPEENISRGSPNPSLSQKRVLKLSNFTKALKEITPSSSEALGSLAEIRRWNDEFGEGRKDKRRRQVWGKGRFGFTEQRADDDGRVLHSTLDSLQEKGTGSP